MSTGISTLRWMGRSLGTNGFGDNDKFRIYFNSSPISSTGFLKFFMLSFGYGGESYISWMFPYFDKG